MYAIRSYYDITLEVCDMLQDMVRCNLCVANPTIDAQNILCMDNGKLKLVDMEGSTYVITSYSIHYTKLYDTSVEAESRLPVGSSASRSFG